MSVRRGRTPLGEAAVVVLGYTALTLAVFRPTLSSLAHTAPAHQGMMADALLYVWAIGHVSRTLFTDPLHVFDGNIFWPASRTLAHSDHMLGQALLGLPVWWATGNPLLIFNLVCLASYPFTAAATYAWVRSLGASPVAAGAAGLAFAFSPFRLRIAQWIQLLVAGFMPLALRSWMRFVAAHRWRDWVLWVLWWTCHGLMGMYLAFYFAVLQGLLALEALVLAPTRRRGRLVLGTVLAPVAVGVLLAPTLWPYAALRVQQGHVRREALDTPLAFLLPYGGTATGWLLGVTNPLAFGPGLVVLALALLGLARRPPRDSPVLPPRLVRLLALSGLVASLLLVVVPAGWLLHLPGFDMLRLTNRALLMALLFLAVFVADGVDVVRARVHGRWAARALAVALLGLVAIDMGRPSEERIRIPLGAELPAVDRWLATHLPPGTPVYEIATGMDPQARAMVASIFNGVRLVNGYSGFTSPGHEYLGQRLYRFPQREALVALDAVGVHWVVARTGSVDAARTLTARAPAPFVNLAADFGRDVVYAVRGVPPQEALATHVRAIDRARLRLAESTPTGTLPLLLDGDRGTAWRLWVPHQQGVPWLTIDLGRPEPVAGVRVVPVEPLAPGIYYCDVQVSDDGTRWADTGVRFRPDDLQRMLHDPASVAYWDARFPTRAVRWIRLINPEHAFWGGWWEMAELDVLLDADASP